MTINLGLIYKTLALLSAGGGRAETYKVLMTLVMSTVPNVFVKAQSQEHKEGFSIWGVSERKKEKGEQRLGKASKASKANRYTNRNRSSQDPGQYFHIWHYWIISHRISLQFSFQFVLKWSQSIEAWKTDLRGRQRNNKSLVLNHKLCTGC